MSQFKSRDEVRMEFPEACHAREVDVRVKVQPVWKRVARVAGWILVGFVALGILMAFLAATGEGLVPVSR